MIVCVYARGGEGVGWRWGGGGGGVSGGGGVVEGGEAEKRFELYRKIFGRERSMRQRRNHRLVLRHM